MPGILKLLKTLCRQAPVLAFMALATSGLATDAKASGWAPPPKDTVTFKSEGSGRESSRATIPISPPPPKNHDITVAFESKIGHDSNAYCNHRAWIVDWKVEIDGDSARNKPIELKSDDLYEGNKYDVPITLCKKGIGNTFKVVWTADTGKPFKKGGNCPTSTSCYMEVTILEEDPPVATLVLKPITIDESGRGTNTSTVTATLDKTAAADVTLNVSASPVSPAVEGDFTLSQHTTLTIPAGKTDSTGTVTITAVDNQVDAPDKTITVSATASGAGVKAPEDKTLTINDDDDAPTGITLAVDPASIAEGASATDIRVTASVDGTTRYDTAKTVQVTVGGDGGTATSGSDYAQVNGFPITIQAGEASATGTFSLNPTEDTDHEGDETIIVAGTSSGITITHATITITDNDDPPPGTPVVQFDSPSSSVAENDGKRDVIVNLSPVAPSGGLTLSYSVAGTATAGSSNDFTIQSSGTVSVVAGAATATIPVAINDDSNAENAETVILTLTGSTDYTLGSTTVHTLTITDNDGTSQAILSLSGTASASEGNSGTSDKYFTVSLSKAPSKSVSWQLCFAGTATIDASGSGTMSASADYQPIFGQTPIDLRGRDPLCTDRVFRTQGSLTNTGLGIRIKGDTDSESDETVIATLSIDDGPDDVVLGTSEVTYTILDDDGTSQSQPVITINGGNAVTEGAAASFTVHASPAPSASLEVNLNISEETGGGQDYVASDDEGGATVTINAGSSTATFTVDTIADSTDEPNGRVMVAVGDGGGYTVGSTSSASVTVNDDDATPSSSLSSPSQPVITIAAGSAVTEGTAANFTLTASPAPSANLDVSVNVTQNGNFVASGDRGTKTVTINAGSSSATFTVPTQDDSTDEPDGSVTATLATGSGYSVGSTSSASVTVNDDDATPSSSTSSFGSDRSLSIDDATAMEKDGVISFTVRLSAATVGNSQATVRVATRDVTAVSGLDYRSVDTRLVFRAGETAKVVTVGLINDAHNEGTETFEVVLSNPSNAVIGDSVATGTINNADYVPQSELAHFGRQVANQVLEGVIGRIRSPRAPGVSARIAGNAVPSGRAPGPNCAVCSALSTDKRVEKFDREQVLTNSSFVLNGQDAPGHSPAFWGRGTRSDFTDRPGSLSLDGGVTSFMLGADLGWNDGRLLGLALIRSSGKIDHMEWAGGGDPNTGRTEMTLTALVPYAGWKINERVDAWGALGHGSGEMHLGLNAGERAEEISTGFDWTMAAGGLRGALAGFDDGPRLTAVLDGWRVRTSSKETEGLAATRSSMTRLRAGLEAGWEMQLADGAVLAPRLETNLIRESGDTGSGFGLELVGGLSWTDPDLGLAIDMSARRLRSDESSGRRDRGYSMALVYDPDPDSGRGLSLSMRQETGNPGSTMDDFLTSSLPGGADEGGTHWTTELAYGLPAVGGSFTGSPHAGIEETDDYRDYKLGWRLTPAGPQAPDISFDINASRREESMSSSADHRLGIGLVAEW